MLIGAMNNISKEVLVKTIKKNLTSDLLKKPYRKKVEDEGAHPSTGHCYVASEAYFHMRGGREAGLKPLFIKHEDESHWVIEDNGEIVDLTKEQFQTPVPYEKSRGKGFLTKEPSARAQVLIGRVLKDIKQAVKIPGQEKKLFRRRP